MKCPHCHKEIGKIKKGHICTQFQEDCGMDGMSDCTEKQCKTCGAVWVRDSLYAPCANRKWRKK